MIGAVTCELVYRNRAAGSQDRTFTQWPVVICSQFVQALSIITACIPYLKPFFVSLETGMIRTDDARRMESKSTRTYWYSRSTGPKKNIASTLLRPMRSKKSEEWTELSTQRVTAAGPNSSTANSQNTGTWDTESLTSQSRIIHDQMPV